LSLIPDEITDTGLTVVKYTKDIKAPRIAECSICPKCQLLWERPVTEGDFNYILAGKAIHASIDETIQSQTKVCTPRAYHF
jgi:flavin reductase (DIM6/NTAB) family NADH-FMN oxidoreductase RutF